MAGKLLFRIIIIAVFCLTFGQNAFGAIGTSPNYSLEIADITNQGTTGSSTSYGFTGVLGDSFDSKSTSSGFKICSGFIEEALGDCLPAIVTPEVPPVVPPTPPPSGGGGGGGSSPWRDRTQAQEEEAEEENLAEDEEEAENEDLDENTNEDEDSVQEESTDESTGEDDNVVRGENIFGDSDNEGFPVQYEGQDNVFGDYESAENETKMADIQNIPNTWEPSGTTETATSAEPFSPALIIPDSFKINGKLLIQPKIITATTPGGLKQIQFLPEDSSIIVIIKENVWCGQNVCFGTPYNTELKSAAERIDARQQELGQQESVQKVTEFSAIYKVNFLPVVLIFILLIVTFLTWRYKAP